MRARILSLTFLIATLPALMIAAPKTKSLPKIRIAKDGRSFETERGELFPEQILALSEDITSLRP